MSTVPLTRPTTGEEELKAVARVLESGMLVQGPLVEAFEDLVADRCGRRFGIAVTSGTTALALALEVLGIGPGDEVIVPALTWPSPAHAILSRQAIPVLADVDPAEWNSTADTVAPCRSPRTRAAIVIDQFGNPVRARELSNALDALPIVEDAACGLGSLFGDGKPCGSLGLVSCLSFHPRKVITTGEGGMCLTDDESIATRLRTLRNHGQEGPGRFSEVGLNHRMSDVAAAIGVAQMGRLDAILEARRERAATYDRELRGFAPQRAPEGSLPNRQTYGVLPAEGLTRERVVDALRARGVQASPLSHALHQVPSVSHAAQVPVPLTHAERIARRGVALPLYPGMSDEDQARVIGALGEVRA